MGNKPSGNFSLRPNNSNTRTAKPGNSAKPTTASTPNPNFVPPATVKKS